MPPDDQYPPSRLFPEPGGGHVPQEVVDALRDVQRPQGRAGMGAPRAWGRRVLVKAQAFPAGPGLVNWQTIIEAEAYDTPQAIVADVDPVPTSTSTTVVLVRVRVRRGEGALTQNAATAGGGVPIDILPPWGLCLPFSGGRMTVEAAILTSDAIPLDRQVNVSLAPGAIVQSWEQDSNNGGFAGAITMAPNAIFASDPIRYARRVQFTVLSGSLVSPVALAAGASIILPAGLWTVTAGALGATITVSWETARAT